MTPDPPALLPEDHTSLHDDLLRMCESIQKEASTDAADDMARRVLADQEALRDLLISTHFEEQVTLRENHEADRAARERKMEEAAIGLRKDCAAYKAGRISEIMMDKAISAIVSAGKGE
jgi:hypothetical protein